MWSERSLGSARFLNANRHPLRLKKSCLALPGRHRIERRAIELVVIAIGDAHRATLLLQLGLHLRQLACQLIGAIGGNLDVFEDDSTLVLELTPTTRSK